MFSQGNVLQKTETNSAEDWWGLRGSGRQQKMAGSWHQVIPSLAIISLGRILDGHQVIAYGDYREQNRDENRNGNQLSAAVVACGTSATEPYRHQRNGQSKPREIEKDFHARTRSYPTSRQNTPTRPLLKSRCYSDSLSSDVTES
jgi:hypothetical protein